MYSTAQYYVAIVSGGRSYGWSARSGTKEIKPRKRIHPAVSTESFCLASTCCTILQLLAGVEGQKGRAEGRSIVSETRCSLVYLCARQGLNERVLWRWLVLGKTVLYHTSHR